jgi:hypothetical protein
MEAHLDDPAAAVEAAVGYVLTEAGLRTPLRSILGAGRYRDDDLLALATRRGEAELADVVGKFRRYADGSWPAVGGYVKDVLVETLMRLTISHVVAPLHEPAQVARDLGALTRLLVMPGDARAG